LPIPRLLARILAPVIDRVLPAIPVEDPWERLALRPAARAFGRGSTHDFGWYLEGESQVEAPSIDAVCEWLLGCEYVGDPELFHEPDFWQHPRTFERLRQGDCEDHALWAWRKLLELGVDAELFCGRWNVEERDAGSHAWVVFRDESGEFVLEATARTRAEMVRPLAEVRAHYRPHACVNSRLRTEAFSGQILTMQEERARRRAERRKGGST
jgi:hypothetical protein